MIKAMSTLFSFVLLASSYVIADDINSSKIILLEESAIIEDINACQSSGLFAYGKNKQNISVINTYQDVVFNTFSKSKSWSVLGPTTLKCMEKGTYLIQYDALLQQKLNGSKIPTNVSLHAIANGSEILGSQAAITISSLSNNQSESVTRAFMHKFKHGDKLKIQIAGSTSKTNIISSITLNIIRVD